MGFLVFLFFLFVLQFSRNRQSITISLVLREFITLSRFIEAIVYLNVIRIPPLSISIYESRFRLKNFLSKIFRYFCDLHVTLYFRFTLFSLWGNSLNFSICKKEFGLLHWTFVCIRNIKLTSNYH